jgi:tetratricopeptide (TPR) repeat protein
VRQARSIGRGIAAAALFASTMSVSAATNDAAAEPAVDVAPCATAIAEADDDRVIARCGALIDNGKTLHADRAKALVARGAAFARRDQIDHAIADDDVALKLDPGADLFNARGELHRRKGDRPRAVADFTAALRLNPWHEVARANNRALARELEQIGADMALKGRLKPPLK